MGRPLAVVLGAGNGVKQASSGASGKDNLEWLDSTHSTTTFLAQPDRKSLIAAAHYISGLHFGRRAKEMAPNELCTTVAGSVCEAQGTLATQQFALLSLPLSLVWLWHDTCCLYKVVTTTMINKWHLTPD